MLVYTRLSVYYFYKYVLRENGMITLHTFTLYLYLLETAVFTVYIFYSKLLWLLFIYIFLL